MQSGAVGALLLLLLLPALKRGHVTRRVHGQRAITQQATADSGKRGKPTTQPISEPASAAAPGGTNPVWDVCRSQCRRGDC